MCGEWLAGGPVEMSWWRWAVESWRGERDLVKVKRVKWRAGRDEKWEGDVCVCGWLVVGR